ncbi:MAG: hypothetical protein R2698_02250 [Microthrixaceae bacterium]
MNRRSSIAAEADVAGNTPSRPDDHRWWRRAAPAVVGSWIVARLAVACGFVLAHLLDGHVRDVGGSLHLRQGLLTWDGTHYALLTEVGFGRAQAESLRFFPLYPLLAKVLSPLAGVDAALAVVSNAAALGAMFVLWRIVVDWGYGESIASRTVWAAAVFPSAFCLAFAYSEALFLLVLFAAVLAVERNRPWPAVAALLAVGLTRPTGVMVVLPVALAAWYRWHRGAGGLCEHEAGARGLSRRAGRGRPVVGWAAAILAPAAGLALYLGFLEKSRGLGSLPLDEQRTLRAGFREPITRLVSAAFDVVRGDFQDLYNLAFAVGALVVVVVALRRRVSVPWTALLVVGILVAASANNIDSFGRYVLTLGPVLPLGIALLVSGHRRGGRVARLAAVACGFAGMAWLTAGALLGRIVP